VKIDEQVLNSEIAAKLSFLDTGTEAALQSGLADVGVQIHTRIGR
jgi:hypothetical protein